MALLTGKQFQTEADTIYYRVNTVSPDRKTLVFLHGLGVDGRMFVPQAKALCDEYNLLIWDAPAHGNSRPFALTFTYMDMAVWLHDILESEEITRPVLIGQSMGGYIAQCFMEQFPGEATGFVAIDSAPLQRDYLTTAELWGLEHVEPLYRLYPWNTLVHSGAKGNAVTPYGQRIVRKLFLSYERDEFCSLAGHGFRELAQAYRADLPYRIDCPCLLICGQHDRAGSTKHYNKKWTERTGLPIKWIENAGHCSNLDAPEEINDILRDFVRNV